MKTSLAALALSICLGLPLRADPIPTAPVLIPIEQVGNAADANGLGAVNYSYQIRNQRITYREYALFLNAVDPSGQNARRLYDERMGSEGGIALQTDQPEGARYQLREGKEDESVRYVDWFDAARYANWLSNGAAPGGDTESGSYHLAATPNQPVPRRGDARYWIPNTHEWYKAAFFIADPERPRYQRWPRWSDTMRNGAVMEIVDAAPEAEGYRPVSRSRGRAVHFIFAHATSAKAADETWGFRLATQNGALEPVAERDKEVLPPPVAEGPLEPVGEGGPGFGPMMPNYGFPPWGNIPLPVETSSDPDRRPAS